MADPHILTGLMAKRAEIAGKIEHLQDQLGQLVIDLDHIDASIHIFDPGDRAGGHQGVAGASASPCIQGPSNPDSAHGPAERQEAAHDPGHRQCLMAERGLDTANVRLLKTMTKRAGACLRNLHQQKAVSRQPGPGQFMLWELAR